MHASSHHDAPPLATNSLEQLLINFANEKLQATFNLHVFAAEQELYAAEGIAWRAVAWPDNAGCIALIAHKERGVAPGLLHLLDETCRLPKTTDAELAERLHAAHVGNAFFPKADPGVQLIEVFGVFAVGYLMRPIGSLVLGPIGDLARRKAILLTSVVVMAA